jgi:hypothetical protein
MLVPLFIMGAAYQLYFTVVVLWRMKLEIDRKKLAVMRQMAMESEG